MCIERVRQMFEEVREWRYQRQVDAVAEAQGGMIPASALNAHDPAPESARLPAPQPLTPDNATRVVTRHL